MAKRIKVKSPRGLSKTKRQIEDIEGLMPKFDTDNAADRGFLSELSHVVRELKKGPQATPPSSTRKQVPKEGNRKFVGPRTLKSEIREDVSARTWDPDYQRGKSPLDVARYMYRNAKSRLTVKRKK
jgi:hypothetical protein